MTTMTTIVLNTLTGAVSEYDWNFQSITPTHAGDAAGFYLLGGADDSGAPIAGSIVTGKTLCGTTLKKRARMAFLSMRGAGSAVFSVFGEVASWTYPFLVRAAGESRAQPGKGIQETYMAFGVANVNGAAFVLDRMEIDLTPSTNRRI